MLVFFAAAARARVVASRFHASLAFPRAQMIIQIG
jgi:hypothetical protein